MDEKEITTYKMLHKKLHFVWFHLSEIFKIEKFRVGLPDNGEF